MSERCPATIERDGTKRCEKPRGHPGPHSIQWGKPLKTTIWQHEENAAR